MKQITFPILFAATLGAAACQMNTADQEMHGHDTSIPIAEQVAAAECKHSVPRRDRWLKADRPTIADVRKGYASAGADPESSAVFGAYEAFVKANGDHEMAAEIFKTLRPNNRYVDAASCFS